MINDEIIIRQLLQRFMDGTTTVDEEERIGRWFREHPSAGKDLEPYRKMFVWFDAGMPQTKKPKRRLWLYAASIAVIVVLSVTFLFINRQPKTTAPQLSSISVMQNDSIRNDETKTKTLRQEAVDTLPSQTVEPKQAGPRKRSYYRHKFSPAPPRPLVAITDSMVEEGDKMVGIELAKMEAEQEAFFSQFAANAALSDSIFTAILQDSDYDEDTDTEVTFY